MSGECVVKINDILTEDRSYLYEGLTLNESRSVKLWETAGHKIAEAALTADQIQQLFQQVEKSATAAGGNRTTIGKGKDVADAVNKAWEDLKTKVQNSGPISNIDQKYDQAAEKLKQATGGDQGVMKYVQKYRDFAKKHPIAQGLIYSALIAAAGISGAGVGGAAALGLLKMTDKLLQGEKFSSAAYSGAKTGALAYGASQLMQYLRSPDTPMPPKTEVKMPNGTMYTVKPGDTISQIAQKNGISVDDMVKANSGQSINISGPSADPAFTQVDTMGNYTGTATEPDNFIKMPKLGNPDAIKPGQEYFVPASAGPTPTYQGGVGTAADTWDKVKSGVYDPSQISANQAAKYNLPGAVANPNAASAATNAATGATNGGYNAVQNAATQAAINAQTNPDWEDEIGQRVAGAGKFAGAQSPKAQFPTGVNPNAKIGMRESRYIDRKLTVYTWALNESVGRSRGGVQLTNEGVMDAIKGAASKAGQWAQTKGHNLTTRVTADKLQSAWKKAGSPTDSEDLAKVLKDAGVSQDIVKQLYTDMKIPLPGSPKEVPPVNTTTGVPQSTPPADPKVTGPKPKPTPKPVAKPAPGATPTTSAPVAKPGATPPAGNAPAQGAQQAPAGNAPAGNAPAGVQDPNPSTWDKIKSFIPGTQARADKVSSEAQAKPWIDKWNRAVRANPAINTPEQLQQFATKLATSENGQQLFQIPPPKDVTPNEAAKYLTTIVDRVAAGVETSGTGATQSTGAQPQTGQQPAQQPAQAATTKAHTGGKVAGQLSQTPNAIRQRQARAAQKQPATGGAGAFGQMAKQLGGTTPNTMANAPVSKVNVASPNNPNQPQATATPAKPAPKVRPKYGQASATPVKVKGATQPGAPTPEEQAVLQQKIAAAQSAADNSTVQESIDLGQVLWDKMIRSRK